MRKIDWPRHAGLSQALDEAAIVAITDRHGTILYCNRKFEAVSGYSREELLGQNHRLVNSGHHSRAFFVDFYRTIGRGQVWRGTFQNRKKSGEFYWVDTTIVPNLGPYGEVETYTAIRFEVSEHVRALKALEVSQEETRKAVEARDLFFANISHEVRTPLNAVLGLSSAMAQTTLSADQSRMLSLIAGAGDALRRVLDDMLDLSKMQAGGFQLAPAPFDPRTVISNTVEMRRAPAEDRGLSLDLQFSDRVQGQLYGDGLRINQIVSNLVSNAVKFTRQGGVMVRVDLVQQDETSHLLIDVEDTGIGFDEKVGARLFQPFVQADDSIVREFGGTGLGLSICRSLAQLMGGNVTARSEPGKGSVFTVSLPVQCLAKPEDNTAAEIDPMADSRMKILLVEDHAVNREVVRCLLAPFDFELVMAEDGQEGLDNYHSQAFDLILMDMQMPRMDGVTAIRHIREHEASHNVARTPIVMLTANATEHHQMQAMTAGADHLVPKPINLEILINGMETGMAASQAWSEKRVGTAA